MQAGVLSWLYQLTLTFCVKLLMGMESSIENYQLIDRHIIIVVAKEKSRSFTIFLLKENCDAGNSLDRNHELVGPVTEANNLPEGATVYIVADKPAAPPWWKDYWGIQEDVRQVSTGAIVFLPVGDRCFALTFGHTRHNLQEICYEYDFGLRSALNALDPKKLKSTDTIQPETAKRHRIQIPVANDLTFFDFDRDESIIKRLTGAVKDEYRDFLTSVTGASSIRITSKSSADKIIETCEKLLEIYMKDDYKKTFPDILNITPEKDPKKIKELDDKLLECFFDNSTNLVLTIPDIIDYTNFSQIKYNGVGWKANTYSDVDIDDYRDCLRARNEGRETVELETIKSNSLGVQNENGDDIIRFPIYKCLLFDHEYKESEHYHLCEGKWYKVEKDYINKLRKELNRAFGDHDLLLDCNEKGEAEYNSYITTAHKNKNIRCLDMKNISPPKQYSVEPCDIYYVHENIVHLIHIKISTLSSKLSHLFNQGVNSIRLLKSYQESRDKLKDLVSESSSDSLIDKKKYKVIYGIITPKNKSDQSDNLPIFSRMSLARTLNALMLMDIECRVVLIKDNVNRKKQVSNKKRVTSG